jgi:hypothetical protein
MVDQVVLRTQQWVNATYGTVPGYNPCDESGHTNWETMFSLTRALQRELGIRPAKQRPAPRRCSFRGPHPNPPLYRSRSRTSARLAV